MKFLGKMCLKIILKFTKPLFRRYIFRKTTGEKGQIDPPPAVLGLRSAVFVTRRNIDCQFEWINSLGKTTKRPKNTAETR